jgi:tetratricopeptide (TPR) repeat protein
LLVSEAGLVVCRYRFTTAKATALAGVVVTVMVSVFCLIPLGGSRASDGRIEEARALLERHRDEEAAEILHALLEEDDSNHEAHMLLTRFHLRRQEHKEAAKSAERAVELDETNSVYRLWLARSYLAKALESGIINAFRYARKGKGEYERAVSLDSSNVEARFELCMYLLAAPGIVGGDKDKGVEQAAIIEAQDSLYGAYAWAGVHERDEDLEKAEASFLRAVELDTSSTYYAKYALGYFYERHERYEDAVTVFRDILARKPDEMNAVFQVGKICIITESNLDEAEQCFKSYLEVEAPPNAPDWAAAHWRLGMVYDLQGEIELALAELRKAVELAPDNKEFRKTLKDVEKKAER